MSRDRELEDRIENHLLLHGPATTRELAEKLGSVMDAVFRSCVYLAADNILQQRRTDLYWEYVYKEK